MVKKEIISGFIVGILLLVSCTYQPVVSEKITVPAPLQKDISLTEDLPPVETKKAIEIGGESKKESKVSEKNIEKESCTNECSQSTCDGLYYISCIVGSDGCKDKQSKKKIIGECGIECLENSDCSSDETCTLNKCLEKPEVLKSLEEAQDVLEEYQSKTDKLNECTKLCAGEEYDIPYVKNEWYSVCYQLYYYAGEEALDEQIADCKK